MMKFCAIWPLTFVFSFSVMAAFLPTSFEADFFQSQKGVVSKKVVETSGVIKYLFPGNISLEVTSPEDQRLVYVKNENKIWHYVPSFIPGELGQLKIQKSGTLFIADFFDTLRNDLQNNPYFKIVTIPKGIELIFNPQSVSKLQIKKAALYFEGKETLFQRLTKIHLIKEDGEQIDLSFKKIKNIEKVSKDSFIFTPPPKTQVIEE